MSTSINHLTKYSSNSFDSQRRELSGKASWRNLPTELILEIVGLVHNDLSAYARLFLASKKFSTLLIDRNPLHMYQTSFTIQSILPLICK